MYNLEKFVPDVFKTLSLEEKEEAVIALAESIFKKFDLQPISISFNPIASGYDSNVLGKFFHYSPFIYINPDFFDKDSDFYKFFPNEEDANAYVPYYLVQTIAHECYHYYQYSLTQKLADNEPLNKEDKDHAYLCFVSLYQKLFSNLNNRFRFADNSTLSDEVLYTYSPTELQANSFGYMMAKKLGEIDKDKDNYLIYQGAQLCNLFSDYEYNYENKGTLTIQTIEYSLYLALAFLDFKKRSIDSDFAFLNIDIEEMKESIKETLKDWQKKEDMRNSNFNNLLKKIKR